MEAIGALLRLLAALLASTIGPAPQLIDPAAGLRLPLLSQSAPSSTTDGLVETARFQQTSEEIPSDLPDATENESPADDFIDPADEEPLDAELPDELADEELLDVAVSEEEPLDAPLDEDVALDDDFVVDEDEFVDVPVTDPAPVADARPVFVLPENFGAGQTIVRNPTGGNTAEVPTDCKVLVQNGRAVVGSGCGAGAADVGPWWAPLVGQSVPVAPGGPAITATGFPFEEPTASGPVTDSFPFDDGGEASGTFPFDDGGVVIAGSSSDDEDQDQGAVRAGSDEDESDEPGLPVPAARIAPTDTDDDRSRGRPDPDRIRRDVSDRLPTAGANRDAPLRSAQTAQTARSGKAKLNPCQTTRKLAKSAKSAKSKKQLNRAKAKCQQFKKAKKPSKPKRQARTDSRTALDRRVS